MKNSPLIPTVAHLIQTTYNLVVVSRCSFLNRRMSEVPKFIILIQS